jgi:hypothetical protein
MAKSTVGTDIHQSLDIGGHVSSEISLHLVFLLDDVSDADHLCLGEFVHFGVLLDIRLFEDLIGRGSPNPVDISEGDLHPFILWKIDSCDTRHNKLLRLCLRVVSLEERYARG